MPNERENYMGIMKRGLKEEWSGYLRREYEFSMAICRSLASDDEVFVNEAFEQGTLLTQADLSILLNESIKTIGRHIKLK